MNKILLIDRWPLFDNRPHKHRIISDLSRNNELFIVFYNNSIHEILHKIILTLKNFFNNWNSRYRYKSHEKTNKLPLLFYIHKKKISYFYSNNLFDLETKNKIIDFDPDYIVPLSSPILPIDFLKLSKKKAINFHISVLPNFRGINALEWTLIYDGKVGVTLYEIDEGVDTGLIINHKILKIKENTIASLKNKLMMQGANMLCDFFNSNLKDSNEAPYSNYIIKKQFYKMSSDLLKISNQKLHRNK